MKVDPNYRKQQKYPSGNEGRLHPGLVHLGSRKWSQRAPYVNEARIRIRDAFLRAFK